MVTDAATMSGFYMDSGHLNAHSHAYIYTLHPLSHLPRPVYLWGFDFFLFLFFFAFFVLFLSQGLVI